MTRGLSKQHVYPIYQSGIQACVAETKWYFCGGKDEHTWHQNMDINDMSHKSIKGILRKKGCNTNIVLRKAVIYIFEIFPHPAH